MSITVKLKHLRIAPRKVRLVADLIRGKKVEAAESQLNFTIKRASQPLKKLLQSAVAAAEHNFHLGKASLYISKIAVDEGPTLKRSRPRAMGRVSPIHKRTAHITLSLEEIEPTRKKAEKITKKTRKRKQVKRADKKTKQPKKKPQLRPEVPKRRVRQRVQKMFRRKAF